MQNRARRIINIAFWCWSPEPALLFSKIRIWSSSSTNAFVQRLAFRPSFPKKLVLQSPTFLCASPPGTQNPTGSRTRTSSGAARNPENKRKVCARHDQPSTHTHTRTYTHARVRRYHLGRTTAREGGWGCSTFPLRIAYPPIALTCLRVRPKMAAIGSVLSRH